MVINGLVVIINTSTRTVVSSLPFNSFIAIGQTLAITPDRACGEDFTSQTLVAKSAFSQFIFPQLQLQFVTVVNLGGFIPPFFAGSSMRGPITLFLNNVQNGIFVGNSATSNCYSPGGGAYTVVSAGPDNIFSQAEPVVIPLLFFKTGPGPITYNVRVVSGSPGQ
jgi:hypothetical protein